MSAALRSEDLTWSQVKRRQTAVAAVSGSESEYTATITPNANQEGNVTVRVKAECCRQMRRGIKVRLGSHVCDSYRHDRTDSDNQWFSDG